MRLKIGSLFDGSGGFPLAGALCGIKPAWASEVEPYPIAVTRSHSPNMIHLGNVMKINGAEIEPVDVLTFGFPCQDVSVAGKRKSVKHKDKGDDETTRSGLVWEAIRIIEEMRCATNGKYPKIVVFENVPGLFSAENGETFRSVIEGLIKTVEPSAVMPDVPKKGWAYADSYIGDGWSLAYRVFDAQYIRTAQRRRRVYAVLDLGGQCARQILFERNGLRGYFTESVTQRQETPTDTQRSVGTDDREGACLSFHLTQDPITNVKCTPCISSGNPKSGQACVGVCYGIDGYNATDTGDKSATLGVNCGMSTGRNRRGTCPCCINVEAGAGAPKHEQDIVGRLVLSIENHPNDSRVKIDDEGKVQALTSRMGTGGGNVPMVMEEKHVICLQGNGIDRADTAQMVVSLMGLS